MRAVLGIGNPGEKYADTRHNAGFIIIDRFVEKFGLKYSPAKADYYFAKGKIDNDDFVVIKPTTFVNNSGFAALDVIEKYDLRIDQLLIVVDDIALPTGTIRIRKSGGSGGHNGLESIIYNLRSENFPRIRFGIGNEFEEGFQANYVLSKFSDEKFNNLELKFDFCGELIKNFIEGNLKAMMDHYSKFYNKINQSTPPAEREEN